MMLRTVDERVERLHRRMDLPVRRTDLAVRRVNLAVPVGMFDFLDSKAFAAASIAAIAAALCYVSGAGGDFGLLVIPPLVALIYWLIFR